MTIPLGNTARQLRDSLGLSQRAAADALGISDVHLCNVEKNRAVPSAALIDRYRELWGVDLYVLAWCLHGDTSKLPKPMRQAALEIARGWDAQIQKLVERHRKQADG